MKDYVLSPADHNVSKAARMRPKARVKGTKNITISQAAHVVVPTPAFRSNKIMNRTAFKNKPPAYVSSTFGGSPAVKMLGKGANGFVYQVDVGNAAARETLHKLIESMANATHGSSLPLSGLVLIKINLPEKGARWDRYVRQSVHESGVHKYLASPATCTKLHCGAVACTAEFVPQFYAAGADTRHGVYVTVMELIRGATLKKYIRNNNNKLSAATFVRIEKAVASMWMAGIAHADFHSANVLVTSKGAVKIIDFGMSVMLPADRRAKVQSILRHVPQVGGTLANAAWYARNTMDNYVETVITKRYNRLPFYNPDGKSLRHLYNQVPTAERSKIKALRQAVWGCGTDEKEAEKAAQTQTQGVSVTNAATPPMTPPATPQPGPYTQQQQRVMYQYQPMQQQQQQMMQGAFPAHYAPGPPASPTASPCGLDQQLVGGRCVRIVGSTFRGMPSHARAEGNPMHGLTDLFMGPAQQPQPQQHQAYLHRPMARAF
jgi:serine/threonine protein kinase